MPKYTIKYNAAELLQQLRSKGLAINNELSNFIIYQHKKKELPLYLMILIGIGTFIASLCFIGFLEVVNIINIFSYNKSSIILGLAFITSAIGLQRAAGQNNTVKHNFLIQYSFICMLIGKILFVVGISQVLHYKWSITLGLLIITSITYNIYQMSIDRFLSSFTMLSSILINIIDYIWGYNTNYLTKLILNACFLIQFTIAAILLTHDKIKQDYIPLSYAFTLSLCMIILFINSQTLLGYISNKKMIDPTFINIVLSIGLIALFIRTAGGIEKLKTTPLILASVGVVLLGYISATGILLTIGIMVLGYAKHENLLIIISALFMTIFIFLHYYNLDISLLQKSVILIISGAVLLTGRFYLKYKI